MSDFNNGLNGLEAAGGLPGTLAAAVGLGIPTLWLLFKKFVLQNKIADTQIASAAANQDVVELLRQELIRLDKRVTELGNENDKLHKENLSLREEVSKLNQTIQTMRQEFGGMRGE
ncbi:hypothetical protein KFZ76_06985 [Methylovulum psychrotolerans]|uniref:hypothetical protein n=1 Tax=Methylovulum psychrotolerans TaxID=1704499 RepID=UPI001BFF0CD9|nr:hypothetical protein [Methylovulum psychrotolerans]MBT9097455.1 hypothetical protein [Methylovulum psychrotolerans]